MERNYLIWGDDFPKIYPVCTLRKWVGSFIKKHFVTSHMRSKTRDLNCWTLVLRRKIFIQTGINYILSLDQSIEHWFLSRYRITRISGPQQTRTYVYLNVVTLRIHPAVETWSLIPGRRLNILEGWGMKDEGKQKVWDNLQVGWQQRDVFTWRTTRLWKVLV